MTNAELLREYFRSVAVVVAAVCILRGTARTNAQRSGPYDDRRWLSISEREDESYERLITYYRDHPSEQDTPVRQVLHELRDRPGEKSPFRDDAVLQQFRDDRAGAAAQGSESLPRCFETATTQLQMNRCARDEAARADAELDRVLRALLIEAVKQPPAAEKVKAAQTAWLAYRDAYLEAMYPARDKSEYGSSYPTERDLLRAKLTVRQVEAFRQMLDHHTGADQPGAAVRPSR
jgi:uncharacterized protein YecT (DUF1311 family)